MSEIHIVAERVGSTYRIPITLSNSDFGIKLDTGAKYTVISATAIKDTLTEEDLERIKSHCEKRCGRREEFISASGHSFFGYPVLAHNVEMGDSILKDFQYYLVVENKRDIALLGFDFIDQCVFSHKTKEDIVLTAFDEGGYGEPNGALENDEVIALIDSLTDV